MDLNPIAIFLEILPWFTSERRKNWNKNIYVLQNYSKNKQNCLGKFRYMVLKFIRNAKYVLLPVHKGNFLRYSFHSFSKIELIYA
jgi:hypothetical protein